MLFMKNAACLRLPSLLLLLAVTSCGSTLPPQALLVVPEAAIPSLSAELKKPPLPSGAYWSDVTQFRKDWQDTLKALPPKSGASSPSTSR